MKRKKDTRAIPPAACCEASLSASAAGPFRTPSRVVGSPRGLPLEKERKRTPRDVCNVPGALLKTNSHGAPRRLLLFLRVFAIFSAPGRSLWWDRLLRSLWYFFSREGFSHSLSSSTAKSNCVLTNISFSTCWAFCFVLFCFFVRKSPSSCDDTEIQFHIQTSEGSEVAN